MAILGVIDEVGRKYVDVDTLALELIPALWRHATQPMLNATQA